MLVSARAVRLLFESCEAAGLDPRDLTGPLGLDRERIEAGARIEWTTLNALLDQLARVAETDARIREIGRRTVHAPASTLVRNLAGTLVSPFTLYDFAINWFSPVNFPGLRTSMRPISRNRIRIHGSILEPHHVSRTFFVLAEGSFPELATVLGLPPAVLVESRITERTHDVVLELPRPLSLLARARVGLRATFRPGDAMAALEEEHQELAKSVEVFMRARDELRGMLERLPDLALVHVDGRIKWCNREAARLLAGGDAARLVGIAIDDVLAADTPVEAMGALVDGGSAGQRHEVTLRPLEGAPVRVEAAAAEDVVFDGVASHLVVARDLTERMQLRQRLVAADRLTSVGLLAAGVAHEVNNPLAYVLNNIEIARSELAARDGATSRGAEALSTALEGVERIRVIVRDLLLLSRGESGPPRPTDVNRVVESTLVLASAEIDRTARLRRELLPVPLVIANESSVAHVFLNLVANALEAMHGRPRDESELVVRTGLLDGRVVLEVADDGVGIPPEQLERIFEPFFTTKPAGKGTGLGLAITQQLVTHLGGEIRVRSVPGEGTTFQVLLRPAGDVA